MGVLCCVVKAQFWGVLVTSIPFILAWERVSYGEVILGKGEDGRAREGRN